MVAIIQNIVIVTAAPQIIETRDEPDPPNIENLKDKISSYNKNITELYKKAVEADWIYQINFSNDTNENAKVIKYIKSINILLFIFKNRYNMQYDE